MGFGTPSQLNVGGGKSSASLRLGPTAGVVYERSRRSTTSSPHVFVGQHQRRLWPNCFNRAVDDRVTRTVGGRECEMGLTEALNCGSGFRRQRRRQRPLDTPVPVIAQPVELVPAVPNTLGEENVDPTTNPFDWARQWYPVAVAADLQAGRPHAVTLLGRELVLWREEGSEGSWHCFEDICPHRLAPLSEGRLEKSREDGNVTLQCAYHGWRFEGDGACVEIPTSQGGGECGDCRSRAKSFPVKVEQDLLWVWADDSPSAHVESAATDAALVEQLNDDRFIGIAPYVRDVAYGYDTLVENVLDPSHLPFAHHQLQFNRGMACPIPTVFDPSSPSRHGFTANVKAYGFVWDITFKPPVLVKHDYGRFGILTYCVPTRPGESRIIMRFFFRRSIGAMMLAAMPVVHHLLANAVMDSDMYILHVQGRNLRRLERSGKSWEQGFFMPTSADNEIVEFRRWFHGPGQNGPKAPNGTRLIEVLAAIPRRVAMDRYEHHTKHCATCRNALKQVKAFQKVVKASAGILGLILAMIAKDGWRCLLARRPLIIALSLAACLFLHSKLKELETKFKYTDYVHWNK